MPMKIEHEGKEITVWTQDEVDAEVKGLKVTNENLKAEKKEIYDKLAETKEIARQMEEAKAKAEGDNETLKRINEEREADSRRAIEDERKKNADILNMMKKEKVDNYLTILVDELKPADTTKAQHLRKLLKADYQFDFDLEKGQFSVTGEGVTGADDLKRKISESEDYRYLLAGSGATGGGSTGGRPSGAGKKWSDMTEAEHVALYKQDPDAYRRSKAANGG